MNIILVGSGGREHAIAHCLAQSPLVKKIVVVPGNGGTAAEPKCKNIDKAACDYIEDNGVSAYVQIAKHEACIMAIVGPENPLAEGLADDFWKADISCIGPKKAAAMEGSSEETALKPAAIKASIRILTVFVWPFSNRSICSEKSMRPSDNKKPRTQPKRTSLG